VKVGIPVPTQIHKNLHQFRGRNVVVKRDLGRSFADVDALDIRMFIENSPNAGTRRAGCGKKHKFMAVGNSHDWVLGAGFSRCLM
jgi:hypothetical protein